MSYCTRKEIEGIGGDFTIPEAFQSSDITEVITSVSNYIDEITHNKFTAGGESKTLVVDGTGTSTIFLMQYTPSPLYSITSIKERSDITVSWSASSVTTLASTDYYIPQGDRHRILLNQTSDTIRTLITVNGYWTKGEANYQIIGVFGHYSVPTTIKKVAILLARDMIQPGYLKSTMVMQEKWADYGYQAMTGWEKRYGKEIPIYTGWPLVDIMLNPYVIKTFDIGVV